MCGIFAALTEGASISHELMTAVTDQLAHRGPDGQRHWISADGHVALGHTRLAVVDLVNGDQPLVSEDGQVVVVVNGEFYSHRRIRRQLEERGHCFNTDTDSEILVHLWEEMGTDCLTRLRGEFAFVLWDARRGVLLAARDRFGVRPLHYSRTHDNLYLASEIKALIAAGVPARWDHQSFFEMCHLYYAPGRTLFREIHQIPPGHYLWAEAGQTRLVKYWDLDYPKRDAALPERSPQEHVLLLRDALDEAIRLRLEADVPVACYLSGGLDSSAVLGMASRHVSGAIEAFTVAFDGGSHDEPAVAEETAKRLGAIHHVLTVTQDMIVDNFADAVWHSETINPNMNGVAKYLLGRRVRQAGLKVVLTGEGADEVAAGYDFLVRDMLLYSGRKLPRRERMLEHLTGPGLPRGDCGVSTDSVRERLRFVPSWVTWFAEAAMHARALWSQSFNAEFNGCDPYGAFLDGLDVDQQIAGREAVHQSLYLWIKSMFVNLLLNQLGDRMEMAHGIEGRLPYLDDRVVVLLRDMPVSMKIRGSNGKYVLREAVRPFVTKSVYRRRKSAFLAPSPALQPTGRMHQMLQDLLRSNLMASVPFFDHRAVVKFLDSIPRIREQGPHALEGIGNQLVYLASACILQGRFNLNE